jgi:phosphate transport system permease protein
MSSPAPARISERIFQTLTRASGVLILAAVASLAGVLTVQAWPALSHAGEYQLLTSTEWVPKPPDDGRPTFGSLAFVYGTVVTSAIALLLAVPFGVASAAFLSEIAPPWVRKVGAFLIELLAAIPSVVYGFWGLFFLAPAVQWVFDRFDGPNTGGNGILAAGIILAIMVLPYITAISFDVCQAVPRSQREGSLALGATRWQTIYSVVLPYARPGIIAAGFLALGRALGETMAVTMLIGNVAEVRLTPFALGDSIASRIANQLNEADYPTYRSALVALGLVLFVVTAVFNGAARLLLLRLSRVRTPKAAPVDEGTNGAESQGAKELPTAPAPRPSDSVSRLPQVKSHALLWNRLMTGVLAGCLLLTVVPLFLILGYIVFHGAGSIEASTFFERGRLPLTDDEFRQYESARRGEAPAPVNEITGRPLVRGGLGHAMLGSLMIVGSASAFAVPLGLLAAVWLAEARRSRLADTVRFVAELLGGVPSIVIGVFAYSVLVAPEYGTGKPLGFSGWAGAFALGVMMIPVVVRSAEESMKLVPESLRQASYALGANRMQTTLRVILPAAFPAIVTGVFLAIGRIAGETAPLILTAGNSDYWPRSMAGPTPFLPGYIFKYSTSQYDDWQRQAWAGAIVLVGVVMLLNIGIRMLAGKRLVAAARAD